MPVAEIEAPRSIRRSPFVRRNLGLIAFGRFVSITGDSICYFSLIWFILESGGTAVQVSLLVACHILPSVFFGPVAGVIADRFDRKSLLIVSDLLCATVIAGLALLLRLDGLTMRAMFAGSTLLALTASLHHPASSALLPDLVPADFLAKANSLETSVSHIAKIVGVTAAGLAYGILGLMGILLVGAGSFLVSAVSQSMLVERWNGSVGFRPAGSSGFSLPGILREMREAFAYLRGEKQLYALLWFLVALGMLTVPTIEVVFPLIFGRVFRTPLAELSYAQGALSLGFAFGSLVCSRLAHTKRPGNRVSMNILFASVTLFLFVIPIWPESGFLPKVGQKVGAYYLLSFAAGAFTAMGLIPANVMFQSRVRSDMMGRVFGLIGSLSNAAIGIGLVMAGWLTDRVPAHFFLLMVSGIMILLSIWMRFSGSLGLSRNGGGKPKANPAGNRI